MAKELIPVYEDQIHSIPQDLYPYQAEDVKRLVQDTHWNNFCEMGTGKTPESIAVCEILNFKRVLIVCPNSLRWEWCRQIKEWTGEDAGVSLRAAKKRLDNFFFKPTKYYIINYESTRISRYKEILLGLNWNCIILDEALKLKQPRTLQYKAMLSMAMEFAPRAKIMALTGSPIINNPADLHSILTITRGDEYGPSGRRIFIDKTCFWVPRRNGGIKVTGVKPGALEKLQEQTASYTVRRTKKEVLPYLPDKYFRYAELQMEDDQRSYYDKMESELFVLLDSGEPLHAPSVLAQLTRLRQINLDPILLGISASSSKTEFIQDMVDTTIVQDDIDFSGNGGEKLVIFSCFAKYIRYLSRLFEHIPHVTLTGDETPDVRAVNVQRFQENSSIKLALGTIQVMGEGITLTAASNVVLADRWWTPAGNAQAIDRLHRIGQKSAVQAIIPINIKTVDQSLSKILRRKEEYAAGYFSDESMIAEVITDLKEG